MFKAVIVPDIVTQSKFPEPSVFKTWPELPSAAGNSSAAPPEEIVYADPEDEIYSPPPASYKYNFAAPANTRSSVDSSQSM